MKAKCSLCLELFTSEGDITAISCGHTFHDLCIQQWMESRASATCPHCRTKIDRKKLIQKLYFDTDVTDLDDPEGTTAGDDDVSCQLRNKVSKLLADIRQRDHDKSKLCEEMTAMTLRLEAAKDQEKKLQSRKQQLMIEVAELKRENDVMKLEKQAMKEARREAHRITQEMKKLTDVKRLIEASEPEVTDMIDSSQNMDDLKLWMKILQRELRVKKVECKNSEKTLLKLQLREGTMNTLESNNKQLKSKIIALGEELKAARLKSSELEAKLNQAWDNQASLMLREESSSSPTPGQDFMDDLIFGSDDDRDVVSKTSQAKLSVLRDTSQVKHRQTRDASHTKSFLSRRPSIVMNVDCTDKQTSVDVPITIDADRPNLTVRCLKSAKSINPKASGRDASSNVIRPKPSLVLPSDDDLTIAMNRSEREEQKYRDCQKRKRANIDNITQYNMFKKRQCGESLSIVRTGYNGLGSHGKHVAPLHTRVEFGMQPKARSGNASFTLGSTKSRGLGKKVGVKSKSATNIPSLDTFISIG